MYSTDVSTYRRYCSVQVVAWCKYQESGGSCAVRIDSVAAISKNPCTVSAMAVRRQRACDSSSPTLQDTYMLLLL